MYHQNFITYVNFVIDFGESKFFVLKVNIFNVIGDNFQLFLNIHYITDDLSYNKLATQSPIYPSSHTLYFARNAVDRNSSTCMRTDLIGRHSHYKKMWWKVDLGGIHNIYSIDILFKTYDSYGKYLFEGFFFN